LTIGWFYICGPSGHLVQAHSHTYPKGVKLYPLAVKWPSINSAMWFRELSLAANAFYAFQARKLHLVVTFMAVFMHCFLVARFWWWWWGEVGVIKATDPLHYESVVSWVLDWGITPPGSVHVDCAVFSVGRHWSGSLHADLPRWRDKVSAELNAFKCYFKLCILICMLAFARHEL